MDVRYIAGFFDGEGGVYITLKTDTRCNKIVRSIRCQIHNTNKEVLKVIQLKFGGQVNPKKRDKKWWKPCFYLEIASQKKTLSFLREILPFLFVKKEQVKVAIKYLESRLEGHKKYTKKEIALADKLRKLTKRSCKE